MPTSIDRDKLSRWREILPPRLSNFLSNFMLTCEPFSPEANYLNYLSDIRSYGATAPVYRKYETELLHAFEEITGYRAKKAG